MITSGKRKFSKILRKEGFSAGQSFLKSLTPGHVEITPRLDLVRNKIAHVIEINNNRKILKSDICGKVENL